MSDGAVAEPERVVPGFWENAELMMRKHLALLGADEEDAASIALDAARRCAHIPAVLADKTPDSFFQGFAVLICDMISAEQRLFAARTGLVPGKLLGNWPPTPIEFDHHPFLIELQGVVSELEAEVNSAGGGRHLN